MSKYCTDCKHSITVPGIPDRFAKCGADQNIESDKETGNQLVEGKSAALEDNLRWRYCSNHRCDGWFAARFLGTCGKEGRWFEEKPYTYS